MERLFALTVAAVLLASLPAHADDDIDAKVKTCEACHGPKGNSTDGNFPILAGQSARYIYIELRDFKEGRRKNEFMTAMAAPMSKQDMLAFGEYFAAQKPRATDFKPDPVKAALGKQKADETLCSMCHQGEFSGSNEIPKVAGQHPQYVIKQLHDFKSRNRTNDAGNMASVSKTLSDEDMENIANYIATLY
ncbi:MAG: cytochrome c4 [Pseudomonadota bacterium]|nr:cytochrome c4 [Pseudomonadota bacterium]